MYVSPSLPNAPRLLDQRLRQVDARHDCATLGQQAAEPALATANVDHRLPVDVSKRVQHPRVEHSGADRLVRIDPVPRRLGPLRA